MSITSKALWYIESHLAGDLSLDTLADAANVSKFHLSRAFALSTGHSLSAYIRGRRLTTAADRLAAGAPDILTVALDAGYGSHEAFTRAFRQQFDLTPEQLRQEPQTLNRQEPIRMNPATTEKLAAPRIIEGEAKLIFGLGEQYSRQKSNAGIPSQWGRFLPHFNHLDHQVGKIAYGVMCNFDDAGHYEYIAGVEVTEFPAQPAEFTRLRIPQQTYAVFDFHEHISAIGATWQAIWNRALPESGHQATDGPFFERYGEDFDGNTGRGGVELWIPIKTR